MTELTAEFLLQHLGQLNFGKKVAVLRGSASGSVWTVRVISGPAWFYNFVTAKLDITTTNTFDIHSSDYFTNDLQAAILVAHAYEAEISKNGFSTALPVAAVKAPVQKVCKFCGEPSLHKDHVCHSPTCEGYGKSRFVEA